MKHLLKVLCILILTSCEKQKEVTTNNVEDFYISRASSSARFR